MAQDPTIPVDNRQAFRDQVSFVMATQLAAMFGGEEVRLYVPKTVPDLRAARDERIARAIEQGEPPQQVARREAVSERHVRRVRGRIGGHFPP